MYDVLKSNSQEKILKIILISLSVILTAMIPVLISLDQLKILGIIIIIPIILILSIYWRDHFIYYFIASMFLSVYFYWPLRLQFVNLFSYVLIFFFITNINSRLFNEFKLPKNLKLSSILLIAAIFLSAINSPFASIKSLYFAYLFCTTLFVSYIIFRSIKESENVKNYLNFFVFATFISGITIIIQIILTDKLRSVSFVGFAYMGFIYNAIIVLLFGNFILGKPDLKSKIMFAVLLITLISTQSRFAWLGFVLAFLYGLIICSIYIKGSLTFLKRKIPLLLTILLLGTALIYASGLDSIVLSRVTNIDFSFFQPDESGEVIKNSLETRILIWVVAINAFLQNPYTGVGYLMFSQVSENYNVLPQSLYVIFVKDLDAHMTFLNFLSETGIIGLSSFLIYIILIFRYSFKSIKLSKDETDIKNSIILNTLIFSIIATSIYSGAYTIGQNSFEMNFIFGLTIGNYLVLLNKQSINLPKDNNLVLN